MFENINRDIFQIILLFLSQDDMYAIKETNKYFYYICTCFNKHINQPDINYICSSKNLFEWAINHPHFYNNRICMVLAKNGQLNVLRYILELGYKYNPEIYFVRII